MKPSTDTPETAPGVTPSPLAGVPRWKRCGLIFLTYLKISAFVLGGGYAIVVAAREEFVRNRRWLTEDELIDMMTVIQTVPGLIGPNSSIYIGWKIARFPGAVAGLCGSLLPSVTVVMLIALGISQFEEFLSLPWVHGMFRGVIAGLVGMIISTACGMTKKIRNAFDVLVAVLCLLGLAVFHCSPGWLILAAIIAGMLKTFWVRRKIQ